MPGVAENDLTTHRVRRPSSRAWRVYLTVYLIGLIPYAFLPVGPLMALYFQVFAWSGVAAMVYRLMREASM